VLESLDLRSPKEGKREDTENEIRETKGMWAFILESIGRGERI